MPLSIPGKTTSSGYQGIQGMSKGSSGVMLGTGKTIKQGVKAKDSQMMPKSKKKKVIINSLLKMMVRGKRHPVSMNDGM